MSSVPAVMILGGYGNTGRIIADLLMENTSVDLIIAGRHAGKAAMLAHELNRKYDAERVVSRMIDASDSHSLKHHLHGVGLLILASSTAAHTETIARAALSAGCDYVDINYAVKKVQTLQLMASEIESAGRCFVTDGGFHPGLPAVMIRAAAAELEELEIATVGSVIAIDWSKLSFSPTTMDEFVREMLDYKALELIDGRWQKPGWNDASRAIDFEGVFGRRSVYPMWLEELKGLTDSIPSLRAGGFYVGGFNRFVDYVVIPMGWLLLKISVKLFARPVSRLMVWGLKKFGQPPFGTVLLLQGHGRSGHQITLRIEHPDGYYLTAAAVTACVLQLLDGSSRKPGLWFQAHLVEPQRMLDDLRRFGVFIQSHDGMVAY